MDSELPQPEFHPLNGQADSFLTTRRAPHYLLAVLAGLSGLLLCLPLAVRRDVAGLSLALGGAWLLYSAWSQVRHARDRRPVLQLDGGGLATRGLPSVLAWHDISDAAPAQRLGRPGLRLTLRDGVVVPGRTGGLFQRSGPAVLHVDLSLLEAADRAMALDAVQCYVARARTATGRGTAPSVRKAQEAEKFAQELQALTQGTWALSAVVAINVLVWIATVLRGLDVFRPDTEELFRWGANSAWAVTRDHEYRRLLASTLLHSGAFHLLSNLLGLWVAGRFANRLYGNTQFLLIYVGSALAGSVASLHFSAQTHVSVGASGAVFGVLGAFLVAMFYYRDRLPRRMGRNLMLSQILFVSYSLIAGFFSSRGIDNAAHVGGLAAGAFIALLLVEKPGESPSVLRRTRRALIASGVTGVLLVLGVRHTPLPPVNHRETFAMQDALARLQPQLTAAWQGWQKDNEALQRGQLAPVDYIRAIESRHMPAFQAMEQSLAVLARARTGAQEALTDARQLVGVTRKVMVLQVQRYRFPGDTATSDGMLSARVEELRQIIRRMAQREAARASPRRAGKDDKPAGR